jgi:hypothetical protein
VQAGPSWAWPGEGEREVEGTSSGPCSPWYFWTAVTGSPEGVQAHGAEIVTLNKTNLRPGRQCRRSSCQPGALDAQARREMQELLDLNSLFPWGALYESNCPVLSAQNYSTILLFCSSGHAAGLEYQPACVCVAQYLSFPACPPSLLAPPPTARTDRRLRLTAHHDRLL